MIVLRRVSSGGRSGSSATMAEICAMSSARTPSQTAASRSSRSAKSS
ncbi:Uncharacterised protein [Mycobacteroides abscessus subsp. abscessus]|nr:Uncharacterised protein [Mycobacteroides abscessus subsp. abscessus]